MNAIFSAKTSMNAAMYIAPSDTVLASAEPVSRASRLKSTELIPISHIPAIAVRTKKVALNAVRRVRDTEMAPL